MRTKNIFIKLLVSILIVLTLFNFISSIDVRLNNSYAATDPASSAEEKKNELLERSDGKTGGILSNFFLGLGVKLCGAIRSVAYTLASAGSSPSGGTSNQEITPFDIFFNKFPLLNANIFSTEGIDPDSMLYSFRTFTAGLYYLIRTIAIAVVFIMLLLNLFRAISKSTTDEQKAAAKNGLIDWVTSFALVMFMHIIVIVLFSFNEMFLSAIESFTQVAKISDFLDALETSIFSTNLILGIASLVVYAVMLVQTGYYILKYLFRLFSIMLYVIFAPIVPITYSAEKMKGGAGVTLNSWLRNVMFLIFSQTAHAIIYASLVGVAMAGLNSQTSVTGVADLGTAIVAVVAMLFVKRGEDIVEKLFGVDRTQILNNNIFSQAFTNIGNSVGMGLGVGVGGGAVRPPVSFGQNIDAKNPSANKGGNTFGSPVGGAVGSARRTLGDKVGNAFAALSGKDGSSSGKSLLREAQAENIDENRTILAGNGSQDNSERERAEQGNGRDGADGLDGLNGSGSSLIGGMALMGGASVGGDIAKDKIADAVRKVTKEEERRKNETEENEETHTTEETVENVEVRNVSSDDSANKNGDEQDRDKDVEIVNENEDEVPQPVAVEEGVNPELLDKCKDEMKAVMDDDMDTIKEWFEEAQNNWDELEEKIDDDKLKEDIIDTIQENWDNDEKLQEFLNGLEDGSIEKDYAEAILGVRAIMNLSDESQKTKEEKIQSIIDSYKAKGVKFSAGSSESESTSKSNATNTSNESNDLNNSNSSNNPSSSNNTNYIGNPTPSNRLSPESVLENEFARISPKDVKSNDNPSDVEVVNNSNDRDGGKLEKERMAKALRDAIKTNKDFNLGIDFDLGIDLEDTNKLEQQYKLVKTKFDAVVNKMSQKLDADKIDLATIEKGMSPSDRRQYRDYLDGKIPANKLSQNAQDAAVYASIQSYMHQLEQQVSRKEGVTFNKSTDNVLRELMERRKNGSSSGDITIGEIITTEKKPE